MKIIALIVAAGSGQRYLGSVPKQYDNIAGLTMLEHSLATFAAVKNIEAIQVVIKPEDLELYYQATKNFALLPVIFGGESRADSVKAGLEAIAQYHPEYVLIHDAARPYVSVDLIEKIIAALLTNLAVIPILPIYETVKRISGEAQLLDRDNLFLIQTPQAFNFSQLFSLVMHNSHQFTDESSLFEAHSLPVAYIAGENINIKITKESDVRREKEVRVGSGFDAHRFALEVSKNNYVLLGGIKIPYLQKILAHSDGDVLIHALVDAILGALALGDIGMHFPPSEAQWQDVDSSVFLEHANSLLKSRNARINNIDLTVICEAPRMGNYRAQIVQNLAKILSIEETRINLKATTTEKMGFTGRGEGIAVQASVIISLPSV